MGRLQEKQKESLKRHIEVSHGHEEEGNYMAAIDSYKSALKIDPSSIEAIDGCSCALLEVGGVDEALKLLDQSIALVPEQNPQKYFTLGQMKEPSADTIRLYRKGIEIATRDMVSIMKEGLKDQLQDQIVSAMCAVAEIYLAMAEQGTTEEDVSRLDAEAEEVVMQALAVSKTPYAMMESSQAMANLRLSQGRVREAFTAMARVLECIRPLLRCSQNVNGMDEKNDSESNIRVGDTKMHEIEDEKIKTDVLDALPSMGVLIAIAKQLLEVKHWNGAKIVLLTIVEECDFNVEVWYLLAMAHLERGELEEASDALAEISKAQESPDGCDGFIEEDMITMLAEKIEIQKKKGTLQGSDPGR
eukprot:Plantae.Rhodophyta-Hildenbrandia_rubra.ctg28445.p1 GENE.Plantae.Rhodophyta-Hildenbrandia_rubra.ctg28445~~Plantae.Rhodophyta-Hildenbrandia_rubra.ctg28445.p1  ORF type:complete len:359 (-),score=76.00 Plantae.Rhodophyta-Hildenbrandia_rubra.ctg28445:567-1643(-)